MSKLSNSSDFSIIFREIMPNIIPFMAAVFVNLLSTAILVSIGLEVLGLGTQNTQTLGTIIYYALTYTALWNGWWWWWFPPVVILVVVFLSFFLISVALDSLANPRMGRA
jgi:peptide/nickel transport system permease protein